ncbi:MAG: hypothetical protein GY711_27875 [bacterium]|nr:hypothetical protein [bacterium]
MHTAPFCEPFVIAALVALFPGVAAAQCPVAEIPMLGTQIQSAPIALSDSPTGPKVGFVDNIGGHVVDVLTGQEILFVPPSPITGARFSDVGIDDQYVVFGDPFGDLDFAGSAPVYHYDSGVLVNVLAEPPGYCDHYGARLDLLDGAALVWEPEAIAPWAARVYYYSDAATAMSSDFLLNNPTGLGTYGWELGLGERAGNVVGVVVGEDKTTWSAYAHDMTTNTPLAAIAGPGRILASAIGGDHVAIGTQDDVWIHDVTTADVVARLPLRQRGDLPRRVSLRFSDGLLAVGTSSPFNGGDLALYDTATWSLVRLIPAPVNATEFGLDVCIDGEYVATVARVPFQMRVLVYSVPRTANDANANGWDDACEWQPGPTVGHWYRATPTLDWPTAEEQAVLWGGHLATVRDDLENTFVVDNFTQGGPPWIGYTDQAVEGTFVWSSGETPGFEHWRVGQPDDLDGADWAVVGLGVGRWRDEPASPARPGVAEVVSDDCDGDAVPDLYDIAVDPARDWNGDALLDDCVSPNYCVATNNSTGVPARVEAFGTPVVAFNNVHLRALDLPTNEFGYFLASAMPGFVPLFGGSAGNLCLALPIVRFNQPPGGAILNSGAAGSFAFRPDLTLLPPGVVFAPGETWHFQAWFRDGATSNTTDGIAVLLR